MATFLEKPTFTPPRIKVLSLLIQCDKFNVKYNFNHFISGFRQLGKGHGSLIGFLLPGKAFLVAFGEGTGNF